MALFRDRIDAGRQLAGRLQHLRDEDPVILALPRGGLPVAREVARALGGPLDVLVARKLGAPGHEEVAIGAITASGARVLNRQELEWLGVPMSYLRDETERQRLVAEAREKSLRAIRPKVTLQGRTVVLVDDGIATGMTVRAALTDLRDQQAARVIIAAPVIAPDTCGELQALADEVVTLATPSEFMGVSQFYDEFRQVQDEEVRAVLRDQGQAATAARPR